MAVASHTLPHPSPSQNSPHEHTLGSLTLSLLLLLDDELDDENELLLLLLLDELLLLLPDDELDDDETELLLEAIRVQFGPAQPPTHTQSPVTSQNPCPEHEESASQR